MYIIFLILQNIIQNSFFGNLEKTRKENFFAKFVDRMSPLVAMMCLSCEDPQKNNLICKTLKSYRKKMEDILVPIFVCVVLPVAIVLIVFLASMNSDNKRAKVLIKAIESNNGIDADRLAEAFKKPVKTARQILNLRLLRGCIFSLIGVALLIFGIIDFKSYDTVDDNFGLMLGAISFAIGVSYLVVFLVTRRNIDNEANDKE